MHTNPIDFRTVGKSDVFKTAEPPKRDSEGRGRGPARGGSPALPRATPLCADLNRVLVYPQSTLGRRCRSA